MIKNIIFLLLFSSLASTGKPTDFTLDLKSDNDIVRSCHYIVENVKKLVEQNRLDAESKTQLVNVLNNDKVLPISRTIVDSIFQKLVVSENPIILDFVVELMRRVNFIKEKTFVADILGMYLIDGKANLVGPDPFLESFQDPSLKRFISLYIQMNIPGRSFDEKINSLTGGIQNNSLVLNGFKKYTIFDLSPYDWLIDPDKELETANSWHIFSAKHADTKAVKGFTAKGFEAIFTVIKAYYNENLVWPKMNQLIKDESFYAWVLLMYLVKAKADDVSNWMISVRNNMESRKRRQSVVGNITDDDPYIETIYFDMEEEEEELPDEENNDDEDDEEEDDEDESDRKEEHKRTHKEEESKLFKIHLIWVVIAWAISFGSGMSVTCYYFIKAAMTGKKEIVGV